VLVANAGGTFGAAEGRADFVVRYNGEVVYPHGGVRGTIDVRDGKGSVFVPYSRFVVGNGNYEVEVTFEGTTQRHVAKIDKWVNAIFLQAYCDQSKQCAYGPAKVATVDAVLTKSAGDPNARVITKGTLNVDVRYRGELRQSNSYVYGFSHEVPGDRSFARIEIPLSKFASQRGWYSIETTFHNEYALGNTWVGNDPRMAASNPPANWIWIDR